MVYNYNVPKDKLKGIGYRPEADPGDWLDGTITVGRSGRLFYRANKESSTTFQLLVLAGTACSRSAKDWEIVETLFDRLPDGDICVITVPMGKTVFVISDNTSIAAINMDGEAIKSATSLDGDPTEDEKLALDLTFYSNTGEYQISATPNGLINTSSPEGEEELKVHNLRPTFAFSPIE